MADGMHIALLASRIEAARRTYYNQTGELVLTDAAFDALEDELRRLDPNHPVLVKVGAPSGGAWPKATHRVPMTSLNKAQVNADLTGWAASCGTVPSGYVVMDKLDGLSVSLCYEQRRLVQALTRGDGTTGEDITRNVLLMQGAVRMLPATLPDGTPTPDVVYVRGEMVVLKSDFAKHFVGESNPRNTASGTSKRQTGHEKCAYLTVIAYRLLLDGVGRDTEVELTTLTKMGFKVPRWAKCADMAAVEAIYQSYVATVRDSLDYVIDGLVVEVNDYKAREALGDLGGRPKAAVAYKFMAPQRVTRLLNIDWQVGHSGRVTPVAVFEPVDFDGTKVERASLAGSRQVEHLKLFAGCQILVSRRNDVIPRVEANVSGGIENDI